MSKRKLSCCIVQSTIKKCDFHFENLGLIWAPISIMDLNLNMLKMKMYLH